ncbi:MAG: geranylgeranylglyceryl/heptaprenylglyceryl phosphate synthase [Candidatus Odinarchaeota archaeon]|nr:geranylgeranylglyceryl/heptaprenylglyceryl phosphate synthase [Candidatus Odinarchaeota archaeon]
MDFKGKVMRYIEERLSEDGALHFTLIDPDPLKMNVESSAKLARIAADCGTAAIMVGGSTAFGIIDDVVKTIKEHVPEIPVILFPGNVNGITRFSDAVFFMSLINSSDTYWIIEAQMLAAFNIKMCRIEPISMAYIIVEPGGTAGYIGHARVIPRNKPKIAAAFALAAEYIGYKMIYLEAGSGAESPIPPYFVRTVREAITRPLIVGGGIREIEQAIEIVKSGADIIVQGTFIEREKEKGIRKLKKIIEGIKNAAHERKIKK